MLCYAFFGIELSKEGDIVKKKYPIKPKDLDTSEEPKGFDNLLGYDQRIVLWAYVQFWQAKGNWDPFTFDEFLLFIDDPKSKVNGSIRSGVMWFMGDRLKSLLETREAEENKEKGKRTYAPSHFLISTYFLWNPA